MKGGLPHHGTGYGRRSRVGEGNARSGHHRAAQRTKRPDTFRGTRAEVRSDVHLGTRILEEVGESGRKRPVLQKILAKGDQQELT